MTHKKTRKKGHDLEIFSISDNFVGSVTNYHREHMKDYAKRQSEPRCPAQSFCDSRWYIIQFVIQQIILEIRNDHNHSAHESEDLLVILDIFLIYII